MKKINRKTLIIMIVIALIIIAIGIVLAVTTVQKKNYVEKGLWVDKEYPNVETKEDALKELKKVCSDCEETNDMEIEGLWIFKSEEKKYYYAFNNEAKVFSEFMSFDDFNGRFKDTKEEENEQDIAEENR